MTNISSSVPTSKIEVKQSATQGPRGFQGWTPVIVQVSDGNRLVNYLQSYVGGTGPLPVALTNIVGKYQKADGSWTSDIAQAFDINSGSAANAAIATTKASETLTSATTAATANTNAQTAKTAAQTAATNADTANTAAQTAKTAAETAATTATTKAAEALNSANQSAASAAAASAVVLGQSTAFPAVQPILIYDFAKSKVLPRTFNVNLPSKTYFDATGKMQISKLNNAVFDHDPATGESLGLSLWAESTNLNLWSENDSLFGGMYVDTLNTKSTTTTKSPYGIVGNVYRGTLDIVDDRFQCNITHTSSSFYTASIYIKKKSNNELADFSIYIAGIETVIATGRFNQTTGAIISTNSASTFFVRNCGDFFRVELTTKLPSDNTSRTIVVQLFPKNQTGNGVIGSTIEWFGLQIEPLKYATPYIPTTNGAVTRFADYLTFDAQKAKNGTFVVETKTVRPHDVSIILNTDLNGVNMRVRYDNNGNLMIQAGVGSTDVNMGQAYTINQYQKIAFYFSINDTKMCINGGTIYSDNTCPNVFEPTLWVLGYLLNGYVKSIVYYPYKLTDSQLQAVTSASNNLAGDKGNQFPTFQRLGSISTLNIEDLIRMRMREVVNYHGTGSQISYIIRRPYAFTLAVVNSNGSTTTTLPTANSDGTYTANTNYTLLHNAPVGTTLTLEIIPVLY